MILYIEKKNGFRSEARLLKEDIDNSMNTSIEDVRIIEVYHADAVILEEDIYTIFSNVVVDNVFYSLEAFEGYHLFRVESIPTQFDERKHWANKLLTAKSRDYTIHYSRIYAVKGVTDRELSQIKRFIINPLESFERRIDDFGPVHIPREEDVSFQPISLVGDLSKIIQEYSLSMSLEDLNMVKEYFDSEGREVNYTELKMLDTYWSDHCRHTTFSKVYTDVDFSDYNVAKAKETFDYIKEHSDKDITLMNLALFSMRKQLADGNLDDLDISDEINASTIKRHLEGEEHLIMFKNETHNHPTEIEPFGGAATCIGGAIRDPLSGRSFVYQAMRITGARNPFENKWLKGKLPQSQICKKSAHGFSSYGNQIGLNTGYVNEYYHPGFEAKRMELGFVIGSNKSENVVRKEPNAGDLLILLGGKTGIDGIGGASGSSKVHKQETKIASASEVQKGNSPEERKIQRLFRKPAISKIIKRCNDLGAGGISVGFGEIADGIEIDLDKVHLKYTNIFASEIFLSESQERMAIVIDESHLELLENHARNENVVVRVIGRVTDNKRLVVKYHNRVLVDIARVFLDKAGAKYYVKAKAKAVDFDNMYNKHPKTTDASNLMRMFDSSIGARNVLNPYGGIYQKTKVDGMVSIIPYTKQSVSIVTSDYDPYLSEWSPFHGAYYAVLNSAIKNMALGANLQGIRFTFQEYFERLGSEESYSKPLLSLLGANTVLNELGLASIGGKDSMSGTYDNGQMKISVPPTLVSFAVNTTDLNRVITPEFKKAESPIAIYAVKKGPDYLVDLAHLKSELDNFYQDNNNKLIRSASHFDANLEEVLINMGRGNGIGFEVDAMYDDYVGIVAELDGEAKGKVIGKTTTLWTYSDEESVVNQLYRPVAKGEPFSYENYRAERKELKKRQTVKVFIPIFEGTNCEDDMRASFEEAGAVVYDFVFTDNTKESIDKLVKYIDEADILAIPGGFSAADEPDGSAKYIANIFRTPRVKKAFNNLISRDGLVIGICNGFQALVNLGVFYDNKIEDYEKINTTLTYNKNMSHIADYVDTQVVSNASAFLRYAEFDTIYKVPISHGEGRFIIDKDTFEQYRRKGQIVSVYIDSPNGSYYNIEGLVSPNGQILGKMAHNERVKDGTAINIYDKKDLKLFQSAVDSLRMEEI